MDALLDSSSLISLARSGLLHLLTLPGVEPVILDVVEEETVKAGLAAGHPDAVAIEVAITGLQRRRAGAGPTRVNAKVIEAATEVGVLVANDLALGRRARNLGVRWLRTADLVVLLVSAGALARPEGRRAIFALTDAGRITSELADDYVKELP